MINNIIFDFDGVIVDSEVLASKAFVKYFNNLGYSLKEDQFYKYAGNKTVEVINLLSQKYKIEKNIVNSIDGATALKLDENYEIKSDEEQNALINNFESHEEHKISEEALKSKVDIDEIPNGVSIESASYMESRVDNKTEDLQNQDITITRENSVEEHTPKLFSDERLQEDLSSETSRDEKEDDQLFDQDVNEEEDFEIPAFLRRQKF